MSQSEQEIVSIYPEANVYNFWTRRRIYCPLYISYKTQQGNMLQNILPPLTNDKRLVLPLKGSYYIFNFYIFKSPNSRKQDLLSNLKYVALYLQIYSPIPILINISVYQYLFRWIGGCVSGTSDQCTLNSTGLLHSLA